MPRDHDDDEGDWELGWLDRQFRDTPLVVLLLFSCCCGEIALIFGILGVALCKDRTARGNASIVLALSAIRFVLSVTAVAVRIYTQK
jgi:hypothetical protein